MIGANAANNLATSNKKTEYAFYLTFKLTLMELHYSLTSVSI
ncbi:hypothetical protein [Vibrio sp. SS-MA-C1-2]|nr:hypothetical protein [Vibrio sp. SS-MA-C1-2]